MLSHMELIEKRATEQRAAFGLFEADLHTAELWKAGRRVKLQGIPFKVLKALLETPGQVVSREHLHSKVWGPDVVVDFEHSLANAVKKLREALGDNADNPVFVETLSRRGFRFIAPVSFGSQYAPSLGGAAMHESVKIHADVFERFASPASTPSLTPVEVQPAVAEPRRETPAPQQPATVHPTGIRWQRPLAYVTATALAGLVAISGFYLGITRRPVRESPRISQITQDGTIYSPKVLLLGTLSALATDGSHVFSPSNDHGRVALSQISLATGASQTVPVPNEIGVPEIEDVSPDRTQLLLRSHLASASQQPLWIVPIDGGSAFRVSDVLAQAAGWMPDGRGIVYTSGNQISVVSLDSGRSTTLATVSGRAFWPRWSPNGKVLRFTLIDVVHHTSSLWELSPGGAPHPVLSGWRQAGLTCCGTWTADGQHYVFEATSEGNTDLWQLEGADREPVRVTNGPLAFKAPLAARAGGGIVFVGQDIHSRLDQYDAAAKQYVPVRGLLSAANHVSYSRDGQWVTWMDDQSRLWRGKTDGSERVLLTPPTMQVFAASWSPDNTAIAFMGRSPGNPWQIYLVRSVGGAPEALIQEDRNLGDPNFSADGKTLVFGTVPELMNQSESSSYLGFLSMATRKVTRVPHSDGLYSPKWSPDGKYIAALTSSQKHLVVYDTQLGTWQQLSAVPADHPTWSRDGQSIFFRAFTMDQKPICRIGLQNKKITEVADLRNFAAGSIMLAEFAGLTPEDLPLMHTEISSGNLYTMDLSVSH